MIIFVFQTSFWKEDGLEESGVAAERTAREPWWAEVQMRVGRPG